MNDRAVALLEQYEIELNYTKKGRGAILCDTNKGLLIFKEYFGNPEKLSLQERLLKQLAGTEGIQVEELLSNKNGELFVQDNDGTKYILKTFPEGRECNIYDKAECMEAVRVLAVLHSGMQLEENGEEHPKESKVPIFSPYQEYEKRNKELVKVRAYLRKKSGKQLFEIELSQVMDEFIEQATQVTLSWKQYEDALQKQDSSHRMMFCHGDYQHHNILISDKSWHIINFEKCIRDNQIRDLYLFMRKLLEKSNWSIALGKDLLEAYQRICPLDAYSYIDLYYRLAYPEKFWKIANFYYNSGKAWIPERNREKLDKLIHQEKDKKQFLDTVFQTVYP